MVLTKDFVDQTLDMSDGYVPMKYDRQSRFVPVLPENTIRIDNGAFEDCDYLYGKCYTHISKDETIIDPNNLINSDNDNNDDVLKKIYHNSICSIYNNGKNCRYCK